MNTDSVNRLQHTATAVRRIWESVTAPASHMSPAETRRASTLTKLILLLAPVVIIDSLFAAQWLHEIVLPVVVVLSYVAAYAVSRTRRHAWGGVPFFFSLWIIPLSIGLFDTEVFFSDLYYFADLIALNIVLAYYLYTLYSRLMMAVGGLIAVSILVGLTDESGHISWAYTFDITLTLLVIALMFTLMRKYEQRERDSVGDALRRSESRFRAIVETQRELICRWLPVTCEITFVNEAYCHYFDLPREQIVGKTIFEMTALDQLVNIQQQMTAIQQQPSETHNHINPLYSKDGRTFRIQWIDTPILDESGRVVEYQAVGRDVTDLLDAEMRLQASEARYRAIVEGQSEFIVRWLPDTFVITFVNEAYCQLHERTRDQLIGQSTLSIIDSPELDRIREEVSDLTVESAQGVFANRYTSPSGRQYGLQWTRHPVLGADGTVIEWMSVGRDVTDLLNAEARLQASESRYRAIVEGQQELIIRWIPKTLVITFVNEAYCRVHERTREQLIGNITLSVIESPDIDAVREYVSNLTLETARGIFENRYISPSGKNYWLQWTTHPILDAEGAVTEWMSVGRDVMTLKQIQTTLDQTQLRYEALLNTVDGIVWEIDSETWETYFISSQVECILGYSPQMILDNSNFWTNQIHPDDRAATITFTREKARQGLPYEVDFRMIAADGRVVWLHDTVNIVSQEGRADRLRGLSVNLTGMRQAQVAEDEQRRLAEALRDTSAFISSTLDMDEVLDRILEVIPRVLPSAVQDIFLLEEDGDTATLVRQRGFERYGIDSTHFTAKLKVSQTPNFRKMMESGNVVTIPNIHQDREWQRSDILREMHTHMGAPITLEGETIGFVNVSSETVNAYNAQDAQKLRAFADPIAIAIRNARLYARARDHVDSLETLVQERTAELQLSSRQLQIVLDGSGEGIFYTEDNAIRFANTAFYRMTGYKVGEIIGVSPSILNADEEQEVNRKLRAIQPTLESDGVWRDELHTKRKDGTTFDAGLTISLAGDIDQQPLRAVTIMRDISKEKALQLQKSHFVAYASHELRTPITNFKTRLYLFRKSPERWETHVQILEEVTERMQRLVEKLLDISRFERGAVPLEWGNVEVQAMIRPVVDLQTPEAERKRQTLQLIAPVDPIVILADWERLTQVITNLVTNAINYTDEGGAVQVKVAVLDNQVQIEVADNGIGIAPQDLPHIFQPFFRVVSAVEGTGLGLSIAREIVETHGGTLEVISKYGQGSTFILCLPLTQPAAVLPTSSLPHNTQQG